MTYLILVVVLVIFFILIMLMDHNQDKADYMDHDTSTFQRRIIDHERKQRDYWNDEHC